ncbi:hypothetical protein INH39_29790 [Massilia violaceinigra]|uniref:Immunity protein 26 n=1 Tax=Massilia violaceinigra TaxID=2045208 RepID=A0ABY4A5W3_9BURK|nr:hypothetical protein [Massilia violaceinigra]UOD29535.1 hypothetical protein INH39_29790 [Massilia violaceinigra]
MSEAKVGDFIAIPSGDRVGLAKLIYVSQFFREVVLLKLYRTTFPEGVTPLPSAEIAADLYYTGSGPILAGRWTIVGFEPVSDAEQLLSKRTVASDIWVADERLGKASESDLEKLPKILTYGSRLIENAVARLAELKNSPTT